MPILTINSGSSSLKFGLYADDATTMLLTGGADHIGSPRAELTLTGPDGKPVPASPGAMPDQTAALNHIAEHLPAAPSAIGHRVVHGGPHLVTHQAITPQLIETLEQSVHFAPLHIPPALALIRATETRFLGVPQFACFDTAFHQTMPPAAFTYPIPREYREAGVRRYGFHGLSYESAVHALMPNVPARLIVAHLGGGSSVCALEHGRSVDTSMGLSPAGGVVMGSRPGDLDPGVILLLTRALSPTLPALTPDAIETMLNHHAGLEALAGTSDMQAVCKQAEAGDPDATLALEIFCRDVAKTIAGYVAVLGGLDALVFTGGIGEHSAEVRSRICHQLAYLGIELETHPPTRLPAVVSTASSRISVHVLAADEDGRIAAHVARMVHAQP